MKILLVAATHFEIQPTIDVLQSRQFKAQSHEISFLITGIGAVATTYVLTNEIFKNRPHVILQAGIAGCFTEHELATTVLIKEDGFADLGVIEGNQFKNIFDLGLADKNEYPFTNGALRNPNKSLLSMIQAENVNGITVNEITTDAKRIKWYQQNGGPAVESMEGAAFHYVCLRQKIPFLQIRSVSNYIGERDKTKWELKGSVKMLNEKLISLIEKISEHDETYFGV
jgi:futalosine hydrolase